MTMLQTLLLLSIAHELHGPHRQLCWDAPAVFTPHVLIGMAYAASFDPPDPADYPVASHA